MSVRVSVARCVFMGFATPLTTKQIEAGAMTEVFKRHRGVEQRASMCFSILGSERTLDLEVLDLPTKLLTM